MKPLTILSYVLASLSTWPAGSMAQAPNGGAPAASQSANEILGAWQTKAQRPMTLVFEPGRCLVSDNGQLTVMKVLKYEPGKVTATTAGAGVVMQWEMKGGQLLVGLGGKMEAFDKLTSAPKEMDITPLMLPAAKVVPADKMGLIRKEFDARAARDQELPRSGAGPTEVAKVVADNTAYVKNVVREYGWIDSARFGLAAQQAAFILVQHSGDLPLMQAVLPLVEKDVKARLAGKATATLPTTGIDAQNYAIFFDRLRLMLGENQRYGTQIGKNDKGQLVLMALEDKAKADQYRHELGLATLAEYLDMVKKQKQAKEILMPE